MMARGKFSGETVRVSVVLDKNDWEDFKALTRILSVKRNNTIPCSVVIREGILKHLENLKSELDLKTG